MVINCYEYFECKMNHGKLQVVQVHLEVAYIVMDQLYIYMNVGFDKAKKWNVASAWSTFNLPYFIHSTILIK